MRKKCFKCGKTKDLKEFYVHKGMGDGHLGKCKECAKKDVLEHRLLHINRIRAYDRERGKLPHRKKLAAKIHQKYKEKYPLRCTANWMLTNAVRDGRIEKPKKCSDCGMETKIHGHHEDYYKPLEVIWLCQICHKKRHE